MTALVAVLFGLGLGAGILMLASALRPHPVPLGEIQARLARRPVPTDTGVERLSDWQLALARVGQRVLAATGLFSTPIQTERLRIVGKSSTRHAYEKMFAATAGATLPVLFAVVLTAGGVSLPPLVVLFAMAVMAVAGFFYPELPLTEQVVVRRREFRHELSAFLDLATIILAGGGGVETALEGAADAGDGWAFTEIRQALRRARMTRRTHWDTLDELGSDLGIAELNELAASVSLAGGQGAKIKESLKAKADAMRSALAAELEAASEKRTEKMIVPVTVMILGLVLFIGFGVVDAISAPSDQFEPVQVEGVEAP